MLAGVYSGDWNTGAEFFDAAKARDHLIAIHTHWPDSSEARFIKESLRWNDEDGRNEYEHFPHHNQQFAASVTGE